MASYKVAQDVEADDKLLGPFNWRQFVYLIIVAASGGLAFGLWQVLPPLVIVPLPIILFFGTLALPLKKDQPMEAWLAAMISFYLKPRLRLWYPDGVISLVEISAPVTSDDSLTKDLSEAEAEKRLDYLSKLADSQGWAIRHAAAPQPQQNPQLQPAFQAQAALTDDPLDESSDLANNFENLIDAADQKRKAEAVQKMRTPQPTPQTVQAQQSIPEPAIPPNYNPYPENIRQQVMQPLSEQNQQAVQAVLQQVQAATTQPQPAVQPEPPRPVNQPTEPIDERPSPAIMNLVDNADGLSIETISKRAHQLEAKDDSEVIIKLR
jgi:hypothetical protein